MDNDSLDFGLSARVLFLAEAKNGLVSVYAGVEGGDEASQYLGFRVSPEKARIIADAIYKAAAKTDAQMPQFPL